MSHSTYESDRELYPVGSKFGRLTVEAIEERVYVLRCGCGKKMKRQAKRITSQMPEQCSACSKQEMSHSISLGSQAKTAIVIRDYEDDEKKMIEEFIKNQKKRKK